MKIYMINNTFRYETENIVRVFFPNEKLEMVNIEENEQESEKPYILTQITDSDSGKTVMASVHFEDYTNAITDTIDFCENESQYISEQERKTAVCIYRLLTEYTGIIPPWGILTGVRPIKLFRRLSENGGKSYAKDYFISELLVSDEKTNLFGLFRGCKMNGIAVARIERT